MLTLLTCTGTGLGRGCILATRAAENPGRCVWGPSSRPLVTPASTKKHPLLSVASGTAIAHPSSGVSLPGKTAGDGLPVIITLPLPVPQPGAADILSCPTPAFPVESSTSLATFRALLCLANVCFPSPSHALFPSSALLVIPNPDSSLNKGPLLVTGVTFTKTFLSLIPKIPNASGIESTPTHQSASSFASITTPTTTLRYHDSNCHLPPSDKEQGSAFGNEFTYPNVTLVARSIRP